MSGLVIQVQALTHRGAVREGNEDRIVVGDWSEAGVMAEPRVSDHDLGGPLGVMVCDGMGGHNAGEVASAIAAETLVPILSQAADATSLAAILRATNRAIFDAAAETPARRGMGTTAAGLHITADGLFWFNVGDSRIFRHRDGFLRQLSVDDIGASGGLTQALGGADAFLEIEPHVEPEPLNPGWRYLLCSDGLTDMVAEEAIEAAINEAPDTAVDRLFQSAMAAGGKDNISIILVSVGA